MQIENILPLLVVAAFLVIVFFSSNYEGPAMVTLNDKVIEAEIADSYKEKMIGLMGHDSLDEGKGMLFINEIPKRSGIWMMNMSFPIDIMWINNHNEVIHIVENAQPCTTNCEIYKPEKSAKYILEVNSGFVKDNNIKLGDSVKIELDGE